VLYVGRLCEQKGTDALLDAWPGVVDAVPEARLVLTGPSGQFGTTGRSELERRAAAAGAVLTGPVPDADLAGVYNCGDVFVMPTRRFEMFGMAALEAQACGRPVVATRVGGLVEVVSPRSGCLVAPDDPSSLAWEITGLLTDERRRDDMSSAARSHAQQFEWSRIAARAREVYAEIGLT
jgi:glycosyltransferase involved in cell wall biosynthesis